MVHSPVAKLDLELLFHMSPGMFGFIYIEFIAVLDGFVYSEETPIHNDMCKINLLFVVFSN